MNKNVLRRIASLQLQGRNGHDKDLLTILANDAETMAKWSTPLSDAERAECNNAIFEHWLAGETTTELAEKVYLPQSHIHDIVKVIGKTRLEHADISEKPPVYNVWNCASCDQRFGQPDPGQIPDQAIVNLLLWLTKPFDTVVDPMAGGGTTADVCRYLLRRCCYFDIDYKRPDIKKWDIRQAVAEKQHPSKSPEGEIRDVLP